MSHFTIGSEADQNWTSFSREICIRHYSNETKNMKTKYTTWTTVKTIYPHQIMFVSFNSNGSHWVPVLTGFCVAESLIFCVVFCQPLLFSFSICHWIVCSSSVYGFMPCCMMYFTGNDDDPLHRTDTDFCPRLWAVLQFISPMQGCRICEQGKYVSPPHSHFEVVPNRPWPHSYACVMQ